MFVVALAVRPTTSWLRTYLANRGLVPVKGRVVFKGQPLQAKVIMVPTKAGGKPIEGLTNAVGEYEMEPLATPGDYAVSITEVGAAKRGLPLQFGSGPLSGLTVSVSAGAQNHFDFDLSD